MIMIISDLLTYLYIDQPHTRKSRGLFAQTNTCHLDICSLNAHASSNTSCLVIAAFTRIKMRFAMLDTCALKANLTFVKHWGWTAAHAFIDAAYSDKVVYALEPVLKEHVTSMTGQIECELVSKCQVHHVPPAALLNHVRDVQCAAWRPSSL